MISSPSQSESRTLALPEIPNWICLSVMALFALGMLANVLFVNPQEVLSDGRMDLAHEFAQRRFFGFHELRAGNLALWNPHCYCGEPFFGAFQPALLYPLNAPYLLLPLDVAINWTIALHVFLGGAFTFYWVRHRGAHSLACLLSGLMFMFCGPHFLQIQAGHLSNLCTLIWAPLLFLAIDQLLDRPGWRPCLLGMFALAMSIFAGHPQYVFYMGVAAGIYSALNLIRPPPSGKVIAGLALMVAGGICLSAVQLFTGLDESRESMRSLGMSYEFASTFSFPPENLLTLFAPRCFGDGKDFDYWGRWYVTESSLFVSVMGLVLAACGMTRGKRRFSITMVVVTLVLAMGKYTPLFHLLYSFVPGFNLFRGTDKFLWLAALFLCLLAGLGLDQFLRGWAAPRWLIASAFAAGAILCGLAFLPRCAGLWSGWLNSIPPGDSPFVNGSLSNHPEFIAQAGGRFSAALIEGGICLFFAAGLLAAVRFNRRAACGGMLFLTALELVCFSRASLMTFQIQPPYPAEILEFLSQQPGDYRIQSNNPNNAMLAGTLDVGGDDPSGLMRYVRYYDFTQGIDLDKAGLNAKATKRDMGSLRMLRCRYAFTEGKEDYWTTKDPLPAALLLEKFRVITNYQAMFPVLTSTNFHADKEVILESRPEPEPVAGGEMGTAQVIESSTDYLIIEAETKSPAILLVTDSFSSGWRAHGLPGSVQAEYQIMPANFCLRAVPLQAGHHLIRMEYSPLGYHIGKIISLVAWPIFIALAVFTLKFKTPSAA